ncbi:hypothetical protein B0H11DRAFT_2184257 [Mycena galericulata]|nr:hypothetical protein B0H11DRAFT_2184257 [Mycena galericulata]
MYRIIRRHLDIFNISTTPESDSTTVRIADAQEHSGRTLQIIRAVLGGSSAVFHLENASARYDTAAERKKSSRKKALCATPGTKPGPTAVLATGHWQTHMYGPTITLNLSAVDFPGAIVRPSPKIRNQGIGFTPWSRRGTPAREFQPRRGNPMSVKHLEDIQSLSSLLSCLAADMASLVIKLRTVVGLICADMAAFGWNLPQISGSELTRSDGTGTTKHYRDHEWLFG